MLRSILGLALLAAAVQAQTRDLTIEKFSEFQKSTKVALVIGVGAYPEDSGLSALKYPAHDAEAVAAALEQQGYAVRKLLDSSATRPIVRKMLNDLGQVIDPNQGSFLFYFAGHGYAQDGVNYLATFGVAADDLKGDGLAIPDVEAMLKKSGARRQMLIVDACRSEPRLGSRDATSRTFSDLTASEGIRALYATRAGAVSYESDELKHGVFTHFLIEGLSGGAANPQDGLVTFRGLSDYVIAKVKSYSVESGKVQVPFEAGESSGDFLVGRALAGSVPSPAPPPQPAPAPSRPLVTPQNSKPLRICAQSLAGLFRSEKGEMLVTTDGIEFNGATPPRKWPKGDIQEVSKHVASVRITLKDGSHWDFLGHTLTDQHCDIKVMDSRALAQDIQTALAGQSGK